MGRVGWLMAGELGGAQGERPGKWAGPGKLIAREWAGSREIDRDVVGAGERAGFGRPGSALEGEDPPFSRF